MLKSLCLSSIILSPKRQNENLIGLNCCMEVLALINKKWSQSEIEYVQYCTSNGISYKVCAQKLNRPIRSIYCIKWKLGLAKSSKWTQTEENEFKKALENNIDLIECAKIFRKSITNVKQKASELGFKITDNKPWTQEEIDYLKYCAENGIKFVFCAAKLKKGLNTIHEKARKLGLENRHKKLWTQEKIEELKKAFQDKISLEECAKKFDRDIVEIKRQAKIFGFLPKKPPNKRWLKTENEQLKKYLLAGLSLAECAKKLNRTKAAVKMHAYSLGYPIKSHMLRKWTQQEKDYMRYCADNGISWIDCAKELNRPLSMVRSMASYYKIKQKSRKKLKVSAVDKAKKINMCLNCTLPDCTNCLGGN